MKPPELPGSHRRRRPVNRARPVDRREHPRDPAGCPQPAVSSWNYHRLGGFAYGTLGQESQVLAPIFTDLAERFAQYADALGEVSQRAEMQTPSGLVRALEQWQRSRDRVTEHLLVERGMVLTRGRALRLQ